MSMMGELTFFLGFQIKQMKEWIFISQEKYTKDLLKRFEIENSKISKTPISTSTKLDKDENGIKVDKKRYRDMIGSLLYLTASRPDIIFSVCVCTRFQASPRGSHLTSFKRIFRYLQGSVNYGLFYSKSATLDLLAYSDVDFA